MRTIQILVFTLLTLMGQAQMKIEFVSVSVLDVGTKYSQVVAKVFVKNLGDDLSIWNVYGTDIYKNGSKELNFYIKYINASTETGYYLPPVSINIKTIYDTWIPMKTPFYEMPYTGSTNFQEWEIVFPKIPNESFNVSIGVYGSYKSVGDMKNADAEIKKRIDEFIAIKDTKIFDYSKFYSDSCIALRDRLSSFVSDYIKNNKVKIINGYSSFSINQLGETKIECFTDNPKFDSLLLLKFKEYKLTQPYKLGYKISASTSFLIFGAHGKSNIKITNGKIIKSSPAISDEILKYLIEEEIHKKFSTPLKTNVDSRYEVEYFIANINNVPDTGNNYIIKEYGSRNFTILFYGAILGFIGLVSILKL